MQLLTPYRVCPLGAHVDHQHGLITGFALDHGVTLHYERTNDGMIEITSHDFAGGARFSVAADCERQMHWSDYARAAAWALRQGQYPLAVGFCGEIAGSLPIGGLSSSASVILSYLRALAILNGFHLTPRQLIDLAHLAETRYIGLNNGVLDQSCEVFGRKDHLLYLDTKDNAFTRIPQANYMPAYEIMIAFSGIERALLHSPFNVRVDECKAAAYALKAFSGMPYADMNKTRLRDVEERVFLAHGDRLPPPWRKRAAHFYGEMNRVAAGVAAWSRGDIAAFGREVFASGTSSIENFETGSPELKRLHDIAMSTKGVYGGRFSGAGFKGCYMALTDPALRDAIQKQFTSEYLAAFPALAGQFSIHFCHTADGLDLAPDAETEV